MPGRRRLPQRLSLRRVGEPASLQAPANRPAGPQGPQHKSTAAGPCALVPLGWLDNGLKVVEGEVVRIDGFLHGRDDPILKSGPD